MSSQPHPTALARHSRPCAREGLTLDELHRLAGRWDRYPVATVTAPQCPTCGAALPPLTSYCSRECYYVAQRRQAHSLAQSRRLEEGVGGYSWPIPMKGDK